MSSVLVLAAGVSLAIYSIDVISGGGVASKTPTYFVYSLGFLALFVTLYPAIPKDERKERLRMYFLVGLVGFLVLIANSALQETGIPVLLISLVLITSVMLSYTIGSLCTNGMKSKKRQKRCGVYYPSWGAVSVSHLFFYPVMGILLAAPSYCSDPVLFGVLGCVVLAISALASMGVRSEGNYWQVVEKKPRSVIGSSTYFIPALTKPPRARRLI